MSGQALADVFTADELARAAGVPADAVRTLAARGGLVPLPGTGLFGVAEILRALPDLRAAAIETAPSYALSPLLGGTTDQDRRSPTARRSLTASLCAHGVLLLLVVLLTSRSTETAQAAPPEELPRLVFLITPGPGGGGGGSGARARTPAPRLEKRGTDRMSVSTPKLSPDPVLANTPREEPPKPEPLPAPVEQPPEPLASSAVIAPLVMAAVTTTERAGVTASRADNDSLGPGAGGDAGGGRGKGSGDGQGSGLGPGSGGGTGGGPYRPGSGIQPPRLIREVKAEYTEDARKRGVTGNVVLEIVIQRDGRVGSITVKRGLGAGLDQRATEAVRQWQFSPAMRQGEAIDVIVEVSVQFNMR